MLGPEGLGEMDNLVVVEARKRRAFFFVSGCLWDCRHRRQTLAQDTDTQTHPGTITDKWTDTNHAKAEDKVKPRRPHGF
jgi:hypothetical protein